MSLATCLACMTDTACAWLPRDNLCLMRSLLTNDTSVPITNSTECPVCVDYASCQACLAVSEQ